MLLACLIASAIAASAPGQAPPAAAAAAPAGPAPSIESVLQKLQETAPGDADEEGAEAPPAAPIPPPAPLRNIPPPSARATPYADLDARAYADAILASARTAQSMQGPLDGGWALSAEDGRRIYSFRFADRGQGMTQAEGAWRDLQSGVVGPAGSGFVSSVGYDGDRLMLRFYETGPDDLVVVTVKPSGEGPWAGELWRKGAVVKVMFARQ